MRYKVKALYCSNGESRVFNSGDEVTEKDFAAGVLAEKLKAGFLEEIEEAPAAPAPEPPPTPSTTPDNQEEEEDPADVSRGTSDDKPAEGVTDEPQAPAAPAPEPPVKEPIPGFDDITVKEIKVILKERGISFEITNNKEELYQKLKAS